MTSATSAGASRHTSQVSLLNIVLFAFMATLPATVVLAAAGQTPADRNHNLAPTPRSTTLFPNDPQAFALFGYSSGVSGNHLVVGAFTADGAASQSGAAYVFEGRERQWVQQSKLLANDGVSFDAFGESIAIDGDTIAIGAPGVTATNGDITGAVYVFRLINQVWIQEAKLTAGDPVDSAEFGGDLGVALSGNTLVVGAKFSFTPPATSGAVYVFQRRGSSWQQAAKLTQPGGGLFESFGGSVAVDRQTLIVGAPTASQVDAASAGAAYIFVRSRGGSWVFQTALRAGDLSPTAAFGSAVGISRDTALIGAPFALNSLGTASGAAYIFHRSSESWKQRAKLSAADGGSFDFFGSQLAISGSSVVIGAEERSTNAGSFAGSAYVFQQEQGQWEQTKELIASDGTAGAKFGCSVALDEKTVLVGAGPQTTQAGVSAGEAYVFQLDERNH